MKTSTRLKLSKVALAFAIAVAIVCTLGLFLSFIAEPAPGMSPAEEADNTHARQMVMVYFWAAWLLVVAVIVYMRWQKRLWKTEREKANVR